MYCSWRSAEDVRFPGTGVTNGSKPPELGGLLVLHYILPTEQALQLLPGLLRSSGRRAGQIV